MSPITKQSRRSNRNRKRIAKSTETELQADSIEKCVICSIEVDMDTLSCRLRETKTGKNRRAEDKDIEKRFKFLLYDCLGIGMESWKEIGLSSKQFQTMIKQARLCDEDFKNVETALKLHGEIQKLSFKLNRIKKCLKNSAVSSFTNEEDQIEDKVKPADYRYLRQFVTTVLTPLPIDVDDPEVPESPQLEIVSTSSNVAEAAMPKDLIKVELDDMDLDFCEIDPTAFKIEDEDRNSNHSSPTPESIGDSAFDNQRTSSNSEDETEANADEVPANESDNSITVEPVKKKRIRKKRENSSKNNKRLKGPKIKTFKCHICHKDGFLTIDERNDHKNNVHGIGAGFRYCCTDCTMQYKNLQDLKTHYRRAHQTTQPFQCDQCPKCYANLKHLNQHISRYHSAEGTQLVPCPTCGKSFKGKWNLARHIDAIHNAGAWYRKPRRCEFCDFVCVDSDSFKKHKAKMHLSTYEPSICDECGKQLSDSRSLSKHKLSQHLKSFKYKCNVCGSGCLYKSHLQAHFKSSHPTLSFENDNHEAQSGQY